MRRLRRALRRPGGLARLFGVVYVAAAVAAALLAWQRPRIETLVHERVAAPGDDAMRALREAQRAGELGDADLDALYRAYLRAAEPERFARLPVLAFDRDADGMSARVRRTLVAGSATQRARAAEFARRACHAEAERVLAWASAWNARVRGDQAALDMPARSMSECDSERRDDERLRSPR